MERIEHKTTGEALVGAKNEIEAIVNNAEGFGFKFADKPQVLKQVLPIIRKHGLAKHLVEHRVTDNGQRVEKTKNGDKVCDWVTGYAIFEIYSKWNEERFRTVIPANFSGQKTIHDATFSALSIADRYFWLIEMDIPTLDENRARKYIAEMKTEESMSPSADLQKEADLMTLRKKMKDSVALQAEVKDKLKVWGLRVPSEMDQEQIKSLLAWEPPVKDNVNNKERS